jgi:hypothetical protein
MSMTDGSKFEEMMERSRQVVQNGIPKPLTGINAQMESAEKAARFIRRNRIAEAAMVVLLGGESSSSIYPIPLAQSCYAIANAMIAESLK